MRTLILSIILVFSVSFTFAENKAFIVGIGHYPQNSGWHTISSANDVKLLCSVLPSDFEVQTLVDSEATYERILKSLFTLREQCSEGDTIFLHFSCHGQQVICNDKEEVDSLDEALVPYDALSKKSEEYDGSRHLLDNELGQYIMLLRKSICPKGLLIVTLDACFSDSMNKGNASQSGNVIYRGGEDIFGSNYISQQRLNEIKERRREIESSALSRSDSLSDVVLISACKSYQKNMEVCIDGRGYGSLSYSIWQTFKKRNFSNVSLWIEDVLMYMSDNAFTQNPQVRTTLDYNSSIIPESVNNDSMSNHTESPKIHFYLLGGVIASMLVVLWKKRKK